MDAQLEAQIEVKEPSMALALEIMTDSGDIIKISSDEKFLVLSVTPKGEKEHSAHMDRDCANKIKDALSLFIQARLLMDR